MLPRRTRRGSIKNARATGAHGMGAGSCVILGALPDLGCCCLGVRVPAPSRPDRVSPMETTTFWMASSLISPQLIRTMFAREKLFWVINPPTPSAEEKGSGDEGLESERDSGGPTSVCKTGLGSTPDNGPNKLPPARQGKPPADGCVPFRTEGAL